MNFEDPVSNAFRLGTPIDDAMRLAGESAVHYHAFTDTPLATWRDGHIEFVSPLDPSLQAPGTSPPPRPLDFRW